ncbi:MAG TPA: hypothetical protein VHI77_09625, partial [Solirubrobacterales bacterium]|nr:hypothetical protein [Solirubrobacterales bacterium]
NLFGGKRGLLVNNANLCAKPRRAGVELVGQNGRRHDSEPVVRTSCKKKPAKPHRHHHRAARG